MRKRVLLVLYAAGILLVVVIRTAAALETSTIGVIPIADNSVTEVYKAEDEVETDAYGAENMSDQNTTFLTLEEQSGDSPKTGDHPAPILAAMGLVLSGVVLVMAFDGMHRKK